MRNDKENIIVNKTIEFSLSIVKYFEVLEQDRKYVIAKQLLPSATSIGADVFQAQNAESQADFIHKMKIAAKKTKEILYWLLLSERSDGYQFDKKLEDDLDEINMILSKIISSSKGRIPGFNLTLLYSFLNFQILKLTHS